MFFSALLFAGGVPGPKLITDGHTRRVIAQHEDPQSAMRGSQGRFRGLAGNDGLVDFA